MSKTIIVGLALFMAGCSTIDHNKHIGGISEPQPLDNRKITVCEGNFLRVGWDCSAIQEWPQWAHPVLIQVFGCAVNWVQNGKIIETVIISSNDFTTSHEVEHARGFTDISEKFESDPAEIARKTDLYRQIIASYGDKCQPYSE